MQNSFLYALPGGLWQDGVPRQLSASPLTAARKFKPTMSTTYIKLGGTVRFPIDTSDSMGQAVNADATPTVVVLDQGTAMGYSAVVTNKATGLYEVALVLTGGNGFTAGHEYSAYATWASSGLTHRVPLASFSLATRNIDDAAYPATTGRSLAVDATGNVTIGAAAAGALTSAAYDNSVAVQVSRTNTAQAGSTSTTIKLDAGASAVDGFYNELVCYIVSGTGAGQSRQITGYVGATKVATVDGAWGTTPDATSVFQLRPMAGAAGAVSGTVNANVTQWSGSAVAAPNVAGVPIVDTKYESGTVQPAPTVAGIPKVEDATLQARLTATRGGYLDNLSAGAVAQASALTTAQTGITAIKAKTDNLPAAPADETAIIAAIASVQADTDNIQTRLPAALVGGRMDSSVGAYAATQNPGGQIKANSLVDKYVYGTTGGSTGKPTSWRERVFVSKAACAAATPGAADGADSEIERYLGAATYNSDGTLASYTFEKDL